MGICSVRVRVRVRVKGDQVNMVALTRQSGRKLTSCMGCGSGSGWGCGSGSGSGWGLGFGFRVRVRDMAETGTITPMESDFPMQVPLLISVRVHSSFRDL